MRYENNEKNKNNSINRVMFLFFVPLFYFGVKYRGRWGCSNVIVSSAMSLGLTLI